MPSMSYNVWKLSAGWDRANTQRIGTKTSKFTKSERKAAADAVVAKMRRTTGQSDRDFDAACDWAWHHTYMHNPTATKAKLKICRRWETPEHKGWSNAVKWRCNHKCVACGAKRNLRAHHLDGWDKHVAKRFDVTNGVALCQGCHDKFHAAYGCGGNTKEQFTEWLATLS